MVPDVALAGALVAVYLADRTRWLAHREAMLECTARATLALGFGWDFEFAGRRPSCARAWRFDSIGFRLTWQAAEVQATAATLATLRARAQALKPVALTSAVSGFAIVVLAPVALLAGQSRGFVALALVAALAAVCGGAIAWSRRTELGLSGWQLLGTTLIAIVCLPCAPNLARAFARSPPAVISLPEAVAALQYSPAEAAARAAARRALEADLVHADAASDGAARLAAAITRLGAA